MGREDDGCALVTKTQYLPAHQLCIDGIEAGERLIENHKRRLVDYGSDELELLRHTLREFLHLFVPPVLDAETLEPVFKLDAGLGRAHALQARKIYGLLPYLHLAVQASFFRHIADHSHILAGNRTSFEQYLSGIGNKDLVDNADKGGLSGSVGAEQTEDATLRNREADIIERHLGTEGFAHTYGLNDRIFVCHYSV